MSKMQDTDDKKWIKTKQRGSGVGVFIVYLFFRIFGYLGLYVVLFFVVLYFTITTLKLKKYIKEYYLLNTGKFNFFIYYKHIYTFALVVSDRMFSKRYLSRYQISIHNIKLIDLENNGIIFLSSHIGDWALGGNVLTQKNVPINIVMEEITKKSIQSFEKSIKDEKINEMKIIDLSEGQIAVAFKIAKALQNKEIVAMMADRYLSLPASIPVEFLGKKIRINKNPFEVAYNRKVPLVAIFTLRVGTYKYDSFYYTLTPFDYSMPKKDAISNVAQKYADLMEKIVKKYPNQWFNHYDYFGSDT